MPFGSWFVARGSWMWVPNDDHDTTTAQEEEEAGYHQRLCDEIGAGNVIELRRLLAHRTPRQWEALLVRAAVRGVPLLEVLVQRGADVRSVAPRLMNTAAGVGQVELLRYLLAARGEPNVASNGEHPLVAACARRHYECARVLLEANADLASLPSRELSKVLVSAVSGSSTSLVRLLAEHRAPIADFVSERGDSLLHSAPSAEMIELLVELGVDPNRVNRAGRSALAVRACFSDTMLLVALLRAHADVNQRDAFEWTPLHHACAASNTRAAAVLIEYGADKHAIAVRTCHRSTQTIDAHTLFAVRDRTSTVDGQVRQRS